MRSLHFQSGTTIPFYYKKLYQIFVFPHTTYLYTYLQFKVFNFQNPLKLLRPKIIFSKPKDVNCSRSNSIRPIKSRKYLLTQHLPRGNCSEIIVAFKRNASNFGPWPPSVSGVMHSANSQVGAKVSPLPPKFRPGSDHKSGAAGASIFGRVKGCGDRKECNWSTVDIRPEEKVPFYRKIYWRPLLSIVRGLEIQTVKSPEFHFCPNGALPFFLSREPFQILSALCSRHICDFSSVYAYAVPFPLKNYPFRRGNDNFFILHRKKDWNWIHLDCAIYHECKEYFSNLSKVGKFERGRLFNNLWDEFSHCSFMLCRVKLSRVSLFEHVSIIYVSATIDRKIHFILIAISELSIMKIRNHIAINTFSVRSLADNRIFQHYRGNPIAQVPENIS